MRSSPSSLVRAAGLLLLMAGSLSAQNPPAAAAQAPPQPRLELSGVLFANYQYGGTAVNRKQNRFDVERVYVNVYAPAGDRVSIRFTTDLFVQRDTTRDGFYRGWALRAKYAWLQYALMKERKDGASLVGRLGLIHTPVAEYEETFFLRYVASGSLDQAGYNSTADAGAALLYTLPSRRGEFYVSVLNGPGYTSREIDRFKDLGARFSFTPFAQQKSFWSTLSITPWFYNGLRASSVVTTLGSPRRRDRFGLFTGVRDPRLRAGLQVAKRLEEVDVAGSTTPREIPGTLVSAFAVAKPRPGALALVLRLDQVTSDQNTGAQDRFFIGGFQYDLSPRAAVTLDMQLRRPNAVSTLVDSRIAFAHFVANF